MVNVGISLFNKLHFLGWCHTMTIHDPPKLRTKILAKPLANPKIGPKNGRVLCWLRNIRKKSVPKTDLRFVYNHMVVFISWDVVTVVVKRKAGQTVRNDHDSGWPTTQIFFFGGIFTPILGVSWWFQFDDIICFRWVGSTINYFGLFVTFESTWVGVKKKITQSMGLGASKHLKTCWRVV